MVQNSFWKFFEPIQNRVKKGAESQLYEPCLWARFAVEDWWGIWTVGKKEELIPDYALHEVFGVKNIWAEV